jgi:hypothetical protein
MGMKIFYVEHMHQKGSVGHIQGMMKAYRRIASSGFESFNDRLTAKKHGKDAMNERFVQAAVKFKPDFVHLGKCESLRGESVRRVKEATGACVIHFYPDFRSRPKPYTADIGRYADWTLLQHQASWIHGLHKKAGCRRVGFWRAGTDPECYYPHDVAKEYDVVFMANPPIRGTGHGKGRFTIVRALADAGISVHIHALIDWAKKGLKPHKNIHLHPYVCQEQFGLACSKARIALGYNTDKVRMYTSWHRWVNSMASGAFFLGHHFPGLDEVFEVGKHLVWFESVGDAVEKAKYYLEHEAEREAIAKAGRQEVLANHTWDNRIARMMGYAREAGYDF